MSLIDEVNWPPKGMNQAWFLSRLGKTWGDEPLSGEVAGVDYTLFYLVSERSGEVWVVTREIEHQDGDMTYALKSMRDLRSDVIDGDAYVERGFDEITLEEYHNATG